MFGRRLLTSVVNLKSPCCTKPSRTTGPNLCRAPRSREVDCPTLSAAPSRPIWIAASWPKAFYACGAATAASISSLRFHAKLAPFAPPAAFGACTTVPVTLSRQSSRALPCGSGCSHCLFGCAFVWPTTGGYAAACSACLLKQCSAGIAIAQKNPRPALRQAATRRLRDLHHPTLFQRPRLQRAFSRSGTGWYLYLEEVRDRPRFLAAPPPTVNDLQKVIDDVCRKVETSLGVTEDDSQYAALWANDEPLLADCAALQFAAARPLESIAGIALSVWGSLSSGLLPTVSSQIFTGVKLIAKLTALVPPPHAHQVVYHGVLSSHARLRPFVVPRTSQQPLPGHDKTEHKPTTRRSLLDWAALLKQVFPLTVMLLVVATAGVT